MYALAALAATFSFYFLLRWISQPQGTQGTLWPSRLEIAWGGATVAALYTIYFSALLLVVQNLCVFVVGLRRADRWALWRRWLLAQGAALALWAPWLILALPRMRSWSVVEQPTSVGFVFQLDGVLLTLGISTHIERYLGAVVVVGFFLLWGTVTLVLEARRTGQLHSAVERLWLLLLGTLLSPLMVWLVTQPRMLFYTPRLEARYFLSFAPLFYAWLGWALAALLNLTRLRPVGAVAAALVLALMLWALPGHYADRRLRDDLQSLVRAIWAQARPEDAVVLVSGNRYPPFLYYYDRAPAPTDRPSVYLVPRWSLMLDESRVKAELEPIVAAHPRIWLAEVEQQLQDPSGVAETWLAKRYARLLTLEFGYNRLHLFGPAGEEVTADRASPQHPLSAEPVAGLEVLGYDLPVREVRPGDPLRLGLYLRVRPPLVPEGLTEEECPWYWLARSSLPEVVLVGPSGGTYATLLTLCPPERVVYQLLEFPAACLPAGQYHFELHAPDGATVSFGKVRVTHTQWVSSPAGIPHPMTARLGESIQLVGYGLHQEWWLFKMALSPGDIVHPGDRLALDLYWQAAEPVGENYTVFTHLVGEAYNPETGGPVWAQEDQEPLSGACPTSLWLPGHLLRDRYELALPKDTPPGEYLLEVGMYRWDTGERLLVSGDGADPTARRLVLTTVRVES